MQDCNLFLFHKRCMLTCLTRLASSSCKGGASVISAGKFGGKQRVVSNGTGVSVAASRPLSSLHLADPASFGLLDVPPVCNLESRSAIAKPGSINLRFARTSGITSGDPASASLNFLNKGLPAMRSLASVVQVILTPFSLLQGLAYGLFVVILCCATNSAEYL